MSKITCVILTYNESKRIQIALGHALKWADEVVVVDKCSTDGTRELAASMGARIVSIPFSRQGHEDQNDIAGAASNDWVWTFTPGEVPTPKLIAEGRRLISDDVDLIFVPMYYYSFGLHSEHSPWSGGYQPRLYHRKRVTFTGEVHRPVHAKRRLMIDCAPDCYVLHQTHGTVADFLRSHVDYMVAEAAPESPQAALERAMNLSASYDDRFEAHPELLPHMLAWKIYWFGVALHAWERGSPGIPESYKARAADLLGKVWPDSGEAGEVPKATPPALPCLLDYSCLYREQVERARDGAVFVELGAFLGESAAYMLCEIAKSGKQIDFKTYDIFIKAPASMEEEAYVKAAGGTPEDACRATIHSRTGIREGVVFNEDSADAANRYADGSVDFCFIDADHSYEGCKRDILAWLPKMRAGGTIAGHDIDLPGVARAVSENFKFFDVRGRSWIART